MKNLIASLVAGILLSLGITSECNGGWNPEGLLLRPFLANVFEARMGTLYQPRQDKLRLDIGGTLDTYSFRPDSVTEVRFGTDFFTLTRLRSEGRFKFPVETADFFFGVNSSLLREFEGYTLAARLRIAHISSHLVDGYQGPLEAFTYSREFVELLLALDWEGLRVYGGGTMLFSSIPDRFGAFNPQLGFDYNLPLATAPPLALVAGYDLRLLTIDNTADVVHSARAGIKLGEHYGGGLTLAGQLYHGKSLHGMFFNQKDSYLAISLLVDY